MLYELLKDRLLQIPGAIIGSGGSEIIMPCRYCDDRSRNMYVSLPINDMPVLYNCYRAVCRKGGVVNHNVLMEWDIYDIELLESINNYNKGKTSRKNSTSDKYIYTKKYNLNNLYISNNPISKYKLEYINKRLDTKLSFDDIIKLKIVLNLNDLLYSNNLKYITRDEKVVRELDRYFIGFIGKDNTFINMRNLKEGGVHKSIDKKYINYIIFKEKNIERLYVIPTKIDLLSVLPIHIHISEGAFDILSIYLNLRKRENNSIYCAMLGSGYIDTVKYFINTLGCPNLVFHIYVDNDVINSFEYNNISKELHNISRLFSIDIYIHNNIYENEKDFGVPLNRIKEQVKKI